ncbi:MAG: hypothetical protein PUK59_07125 [Actinomycetaceae bacterium]|nr:hypothetical protein [Actinomycetaceae bacterium]MDY5854941.1 hypothetical protein [Arcanobacterium sp.]
MDDTNLHFMNSLTLAELATFEQTAGISFDKIGTADPMTLMPALAVFAAKRLGLDQSAEILSQLTMDELQELFAAATQATPSRPDEINRILETVRGKSRANSSKR